VEDLARTRHGIGVVSETDDLTRGFEQKAQWGVVLAPFEVGVGVALGLVFGDGEVFARAVFLGFDDPDRIAVDEQHIVRRAAVGGVFAHHDTERGTEVELLHVLNDPAGVFQLLVDLLASFRFWSQRSVLSVVCRTNAKARSSDLGL